MMGRGRRGLWPAWKANAGAGLAVLCMLLTAACAPVEGPAAAPQPGSGEPQRGGSLVFSGRYSTDTLHPFKTGSSAPERRTVGLVYETLLGFKREPGQDYRVNYEVVPWLAEGWEQPNDTTYVFRLRRGVNWHDGQPFTADDVLFTHDWAKREKFAVAAQYKGVQSIEKLDDYALRMVLTAPSAYFLDALALEAAYVAPKHLQEQGVDFGKAAVGTGPFRLQSFDRTGESVFSRNEGYWQPGKPFLDEIRQLWGLDFSAELASFIVRKTDLLALVERPRLDTVLKERPEAVYDTLPTDNGISLVMQVGRPPFEDLRVRRALDLAVDRQAMLKTLTEGDGVINPPGVPGWKKGWAIPAAELSQLPGYRQPKNQDIAEAKRLLAEAGYPAGLKFTLPIGKDSPIPLPIAEVMAAQFRAIGAEMNIALHDNATFTKMQNAGEFDAIVWIDFSSRPGEQRLAQRHHSKGVLNKIGQNDPRLDELLDAIPAALDVQGGKQATVDLQRYLLEKVYLVPTIEFALYLVRQPWIHDYRGQPIVINMVDHVNAPYIWLDKERVPGDRQ